MKKCAETIQKQTMGVIFNIKNSVIELVLTNRRNQPVANLPVVNFLSQL